MDYRKNFMVEPGAKVRLSKMNPSYTGKHESQEKAAPEISKHIERMAKLQYLLYADGSQSLLVVLQALDAAGKDGVIRHVLSGMNPQGTSVFGFKQPSKDEAAHDFLWRAHLRAPGKGEVVIFNRSHYEDVLVVRVRKLVPHSVWSKRYGLINDFEEMLSRNGTSKSSCLVSSSGSTIHRGIGRSAKMTTPNASYGRNTSMRTKTPSH
jgi:polyphosphate kinase 2 (PPK2 family)